MPLDLPDDLKTDLVVCGLSGKRYTGVHELSAILKPLLLEGRVTLVPRDGLCSLEALNRYIKWAKASFFIRVEATDAVREAKGWRAEFGPEDHVRDEHWTETGLDSWDGWDEVIHHDGRDDTLLEKANALAPKINALVKNPALCKHTATPPRLLHKTEFTSPIPECMLPGWGSNPPTRNADGTYNFKAKDNQPLPAAKQPGQQATSSQAPVYTPPKKANPALEAAAARAASASAAAMGEVGPPTVARSGQGTAESEAETGTASETDAGGAGVTRSSGRTLGGWDADGQPESGGRGGSTSSWAGWSSWGNTAASGQRQRSSSRVRWGEDWESSWSGGGWGSSGAAAAAQQPWKEGGEAQGGAEATSWSKGWYDSRGGWGSGWGSWSS